MSTLGRVKCAVLGARGLVAQRLLQRLAGHHWFVPVCVVGSPESDGEKITDLPWSFSGPRPSFPELEVIGIGQNDELANHLISEGVRIVFSALPDSPASYIEEELAMAGLVVISHSTIHRHSEKVPLIVPEVNNDHLKLIDFQLDYGQGMLVSCSNCMVVPLAISIAPLVRGIPAERIMISTEQSLSGGGRTMLENSRKKIFPDAKIPGESLSVESELKRILGDFDGLVVEPTKISVEAECKRVRREFGHSASVTVYFSQNVSAHQVMDIWSDFQTPIQHLDLPSSGKSPIRFVSDIEGAIDIPQKLEHTTTQQSLQSYMEVNIGNIQVSGNIVSFDVISDNTIRGAAGNSVLLAEMMLAQGIIHDSSSALHLGQVSNKHNQ